MTAASNTYTNCSPSTPVHSATKNTRAFFSLSPITVRGRNILNPYHPGKQHKHRLNLLFLRRSADWASVPTQDVGHSFSCGMFLMSFVCLIMLSFKQFICFLTILRQHHETSAHNPRSSSLQGSKGIMTLLSSTSSFLPSLYSTSHFHVNSCARHTPRLSGDLPGPTHSYVPCSAQSSTYLTTTCAPTPETNGTLPGSICCDTPCRGGPSGGGESAHL